MPKRTYIDSCVLLAAFQGRDDLGIRALEILDDAERQLVVSDAVLLEVMPKARYQRNSEEISFYEAVFEYAEKCNWNVEVLQKAQSFAEKYGIAAMDAIHIATAIDAEAEEFITAEKSTKPMFRVNEINVISIREGIA